MNRFSIGKALTITGAIIMGFCLLGLFAGPNGEHAAVFWGALAGTLLGLGLSVTGFLLAFAPRHTASEYKTLYETYPADPSIDYQKELTTVRTNFAADSDPKKNRIVKVNYMGAEPYCDFGVIGSGKIYYSYLVEANNKLFQNKKLAALTEPAVVVYSTEEYFEKNPLALKKLAHYLFKNRNAKNWVGDNLRNERRYFSNLRVPMELTDGHEIYMTTIMIYRRHLPLGYLSDSLLPIIADPLSQTAVFVVDVKYWTPPLIGNFMHGSAANDDVVHE